MANPDFNYKPDTSIIQAYQNALQQKMQAEQAQRQEHQQKFQQTLETTKAIGSIVSGMVQIAEHRKTNNLIARAKDILSKPEPSATVIPEGPGLPNNNLEETPLAPIPNPAVEQHRRALLDISSALNSKSLGQIASKELMSGTTAGKEFAPQQGSIETTDGKIIPVVFKGGQYYYANTNDLVPNEKIAGKGYGMVPITTGSGNVEMTSRGTGKPLSNVSTTNQTIPNEKRGTVNELTGLETRDRDKVFGMIDAAKVDPLISKNRSVLQTVNGLRKAIKSDDKVAMDRMGGLMQKIVAQDSGNLAAWEQRDPNSRAALDRLNNWISFALQGKPQKETKDMILKTIDNMEEVARGVIDNSFDLAATSVVESFPQLNKKAVLKKMGKEALNKTAGTPEQEAEDFFRGL